MEKKLLLLKFEESTEVKKTFISSRGSVEIYPTDSTPGSAAERLAAEALFERARECGTASLGRLTPTAARLAVVDAEYARRFAPGRSR